MKYILCIIVGFLIGFILNECTHKCPVCPEVKESIDSSRKQLPPVIKETENPKPVRSYPVRGEDLRTNVLDNMANSINTNPCDSFRVYSDTLKDPAGTIISQDSVRGQLLKKKITFIPNYLTVTITKEIEKPVPQSGLFIGLEAGWGQGGSRVAPEVSYLNRKGWICSYNYDLLNKVHSGGIKKRLL
jgi:hypothetical protein